MKTMIMADYAVTKGILLQQIVLSVLVSAFASIVVGNAFMLIPMMAVMIPLSYMLTLVAYDETNGWERYRLTFPLTRAQTVAGRYIFMIVLALGSLVLALLTHGLFYLVAPALSTLPFGAEFSASMMESDLTTLAFSSAIALFIVLVLSSIIYPFSFRFGMVRALRWVPMALVVIFLAAGTAVQYVNPQLFADVINWLDAPDGVGMAIAVGVLGCAAITLASAVLATKLYQKREF